MKLRLLSKPDKTAHQVPTQNVPLGLPKSVKSICPVCSEVIDANILEEYNKVVMRKTCKKHGEVYDIISNDVELYLDIEKWAFEDFKGIENPQIKNATKCPQQCGLCNLHISNNCLVNIDLTNRCNLNCPICFANANKKGYVYELSFEQAVKCLETAKLIKPLDYHAVQFSGGEPTIHPRFLDIVKKAKEMGFKHIQIATNGIKIAQDLEFARKCKEYGIYTLYLQFDGVGEEVYYKTRGVPLFNDIKKKVIENCRKVGLKVVFVPTVVKTINDQKVGEIFNYAVENADVVSGVAYQPVSFCGRISEKERLKKRYTTYDLAHDLEKQTGYIKARKNWNSLAVTMPMSRLMSFLYGKMHIHISCHSNCGSGEYFFVNLKDKRVIPMTEAVNLRELMRNFNEIVDSIGKSTVTTKAYVTMKALNALRKNFNKEKMPKEFTLKTFLITLGRLVNKTVYDKFKSHPWTMSFAAGMHFQDKYNLNIDRLRRCVIHYAAPNGMLYPFCNYNSGMVFREMIERKFAVPLEKWERERGSEYITTGFYKAKA